MFCFKPKLVMPRGDPRDWSSAEVKQWMQFKKLDACKAQLSSLTGQELLTLDLDDLESKFSAVPPALVTSLNSLRGQWQLAPLQKKAPPPVQPDPETLAPALDIHQPATSTTTPTLDETTLDVTLSPNTLPSMVEVLSAATAPNAAASLAIEDPSQEPAATDMTTASPKPQSPAHEPLEQQSVVPAITLPQPVEEMTQLEIPDRVTMDSMVLDGGSERVTQEPRVTEESVVDPQPTVMASSPTAAVVVSPGPLFVPIKDPVGVQDWARTLQSYVPEMEVDSIARYLESLGKGMGGGLSDGAMAQPSVGEVFRCAVEMSSTAERAGVARENCLKAAALAQDTLKILDVAWRRMHSAGQDTPSEFLFSEEALEQIMSGLKALTALVLPFTQPGWLLEMCCNEKIKDEFDVAHNQVISGLKTEGLDMLPGGKPLPRGDYRDLPKGVRRLVKQHGSGNITAGLMKLKASGVQSEGVKELSGLLDLEEVYGGPLVMAELDALPTESGLDLEDYYSQLVMGGNAGKMYHVVFDWYDKEHNSGYIDLARFQNLLKDLGMLEGKSEAEAQAYVLASFRAADTKGQGMLGRDEFCAYYSTLTTTKARQQLRARMGLAAEEELRGVFTSFASFGSRVEVTDIDNARFFKLTKDCGLVSSQLTSTDVDLIFTRVKAKSLRRMNFDQFLEALSLCADKKGTTLEAVVRKVLQTGGPIAHATKPEFTRLHDDKSTYTGVYSKGGPKAVDPVRNDLAALLDRSEADVRGVKKNVPLPKAAPPVKAGALSSRKAPMHSPPPADFLRTSLGPGSLALAGLKTSPATVSVARRTPGTPPPGGSDLREMFAAFATFGNASAMASPNGPARIEMDGSKFLKLCRECRLLDATSKQDGLNPTRADLIFTKVKQQGHNKINFQEFQRALQLVAEAKGTSADEIVNTICNSDGPLLTRIVS